MGRARIARSRRRPNRASRLHARPAPVQGVWHRRISDAAPRHRCEGCRRTEALPVLGPADARRPRRLCDRRLAGARGMCANASHTPARRSLPWASTWLVSTATPAPSDSTGGPDSLSYAADDPTKQPEPKPTRYPWSALSELVGRNLQKAACLALGIALCVLFAFRRKPARDLAGGVDVRYSSPSAGQAARTFGNVPLSQQGPARESPPPPRPLLRHRRRRAPLATSPCRSSDLHASRMLSEAQRAPCPHPRERDVPLLSTTSVTRALAVAVSLT